MLNPGGAAASCAIDNAGAIRAKAARAMFENLHMVLSGGRKNGEALLRRYSKYRVCLGTYIYWKNAIYWTEIWMHCPDRDLTDERSELLTISHMEGTTIIRESPVARWVGSSGYIGSWLTKRGSLRPCDGGWRKGGGICVPMTNNKRGSEVLQFETN